MKWMRTEAFLSVLIIALAFASGVLVLSIRNGPSTHASLPILQQEIQKFKKITTPLDLLKIDGIAEIIDPKNALPSYFKFNYQEIQELKGFSNSCKLKNYKKSEALAKAWQWEESKCGLRKLNSDFFSNQPFFHPNGHSFAFLAKKDATWTASNLNLFHASELKDLKLSNLPSPYIYDGFDYRRFSHCYGSVCFYKFTRRHRVRNFPNNYMG